MPDSTHSHTDADQHSPPDTEELIARQQEYLNGWKRALADYENLKRQSQQHAEELRKLTLIDYTVDILPLIDIYYQTLNHIPEKHRSETWYIGFSQIQAEWDKFMKNHGIERLTPLGAKFDPKLHEAIATEENADIPNDTVLSVIADGYTIAGSLLRPAQVTVNKLTTN